MISAVSNHGAAISAKRIMRMAPMAKFGAMRQLLRVKVAAKRSQVGVGEPGGAHHGVDAVLGGKARFSRAASRWVKSTTTSTPGGDERVGRAGDTWRSDVEPGDVAQVDAGVEGVDGGDELERGVAEHGAAHRRAHAARRPRTPRPSSWRRER